MGDLTFACHAPIGIGRFSRLLSSREHGLGWNVPTDERHWDFAGQEVSAPH